jgi:hypothetical protein
VRVGPAMVRVAGPGGGSARGGGMGAALVARGGGWGRARGRGGGTGVAGRRLDGEERQRGWPSAGSDGGERRWRGSE